MKSCVVTATYATSPAKVWLYMSNPNLNGWRTDLQSAEISDDGMKVTEKNKDGSITTVNFSVKEKNRKMTCTFQRGRIKGAYTVILLGGGDSTSAECTLSVEGLGLFAKPKKLLEAHMDMLRKGLGE